MKLLSLALLYKIRQFTNFPSLAHARTIAVGSKTILLPLEEVLSLEIITEFCAKTCSLSDLSPTEETEFSLMLVSLP